MDNNESKGIFKNLASHYHLKKKFMVAVSKPILVDKE